MNNFEKKEQLFDINILYEIVTTAIILYLIEEKHESSESLDEEHVADFVLKHFPSIIESITNDTDKATDVAR